MDDKTRLYIRAINDFGTAITNITEALDKVKSAVSVIIDYAAPEEISDDHKRATGATNDPR